MASGRGGAGAGMDGLVINGVLCWIAFLIAFLVVIWGFQSGSFLFIKLEMLQELLIGEWNHAAA